jgi:hypothetical protein
MEDRTKFALVYSLVCLRLRNNVSNLANYCQGSDSLCHSERGAAIKGDILSGFSAKEVGRIGPINSIPAVSPTINLCVSGTEASRLGVADIVTVEVSLVKSHRERAQGLSPVSPCKLAVLILNFRTASENGWGDSPECFKGR